MLASIVLICALVILGILAGVILPQRRSRKLSACARALGYSFEPLARPFESSDVSGLSLFKDLEGDSALIAENVVRGTISGHSFVAFDCISYWAESTVVMTTFIAFRSPAKRPVFQLSAKSVIERIEEKLGRKCTQLHVDKKLHFHMQCWDEAETRTFLTPAKLAGIGEQLHDLHLECNADWVVVYRPGTKVKVSELAEFVAAAQSLASVLLSPEQLLPTMGRTA